MSDCGKKSKGKDNPARHPDWGFGLSVVSVTSQSDGPTPNGHAKFESERAPEKTRPVTTSVFSSPYSTVSAAMVKRMSAHLTKKLIRPKRTKMTQALEFDTKYRAIEPITMIADPSVAGLPNLR